MDLREELKNYIPVYLWERIEHPEGYVVGNEEYNARWNLLQTQGDQQANAIKDLIDLLYQTVLNDEDGASHIRIANPHYNAENLQEVLNIIHETFNSNSLSLALHKNSGDHDHRYYRKEQIDTRQWGTINIANGAITAQKLDPDLITDMQLVQYIGIAETIQRRLEIITILGV